MRRGGGRLLKQKVQPRLGKLYLSIKFMDTTCFARSPENDTPNSYLFFNTNQAATNLAFHSNETSILAFSNIKLAVYYCHPVA